jgi:hypothetical protein
VLNSVLKFVGGSWKLVGVAMISSGITLIAAPYFDFQKEERAALASDLAKMNETSQSFHDIIQQYANRAVNGSDIDKKTEDAAQSSINHLYDEAAVISKRNPEIHDDFQDYVSSLVALHQAMQNLHGAADGGKEFVESTSRYFAAQSRFNSKATQLQKGFFRSVGKGLVS